jgi:hypothetical protein
MSRYRIPPDDPRYEVIIGWDDPLETYFATVFDPPVDADDGAACVLWVGSALRALPTVALLQACLRGYATIPADVVAQLQQDGAHTTPRSPLQERMVQMMAQSRDEKEPR